MVEISKLSNGIRIVIETVPNVRSVALGIYVECGSASENEMNNGISHMIEHMMFKGTSNRTAKELAIQTAFLGDDMNAYTSKELTCYYARVLDEHFPVMVDIMGDMFTNSLFQVEDLEREKSVILDEIDMYEDSPEDLVQEQIQKLCWDGHPLSYIISGTKENVTRITRDELYDFFKTNYVAENIVISVAGNIEFDTTKDLLEKHFGMIPTVCKENGIGSNTDIPTYIPARAHFNKDTEQVHLCIGFPGISHDSKDNHTFAILNNIIGGSSSSRLFQQIREERGLCYSIYSYGSSYKRTGTFQIYAAMGEENVEAVYEETLHVLEALIHNGITQEEMKQTLAQIRSELLLSHENTHNRMNNNARNLIYQNRIITIEETMDKLEHVTNDNVIDFMNRYIERNQISLTYGWRL